MTENLKLVQGDVRFMMHCGHSNYFLFISNGAEDIWHLSLICCWGCICMAMASAKFLELIQKWR